MFLNTTEPFITTSANFLNITSTKSDGVSLNITNYLIISFCLFILSYKNNLGF